MPRNRSEKVGILLTKQVIYGPLSTVQVAIVGLTDGRFCVRAQHPHGEPKYKFKDFASKGVAALAYGTIQNGFHYADAMPGEDGWWWSESGEPFDAT